jgi:serine/threonine protein kinase
MSQPQRKMKIHKKNTFTDIYVQQTVGISGEIQVFKLKLKDEYAENKPLRAHFISSAKALKTYSGKQFLTFLQLIDNEQEAAILFQTKTAKSLPEYLAEKENLSDQELTTLFEQMAQCLGTLHQGMLFYPALQPSSFFVDTDGQVQLCFFDIVEFRMYQYQQITPDSKLGFMNYTSPERKGNFFSISLESDIYSLGLIYWHIFLFAKSPVKNWKLITENTYFSSTETVWDDFFETCLQEEVAKRYKNINALVKGLPRFGNETKTFEKKNPLSSTIPKEFIIRKLDSKKYGVKVNGIEISTALNTSKGELKIAISTENLLIEIYDITSRKIILVHDTRISKTYELTIPSVERQDILLSQEIVKNASLKLNSKILISIISLLFIFGLGLTGWQLGWYEGAKENSPSVLTTGNATSNEEVLDTLKEDKTVFLIDYPGYTLKSKYPEFKTEEGFKEPNDDIYRLKDGKLEVKYYQKATKNYGAWTEMKNPLLALVLKGYFVKNDLGNSPEDTEKTTNGGSNTGDTKTGGTSTGGSNSGGFNSGGSNSVGGNVGKKCNALLLFKNNAKTDINNARKSGNKRTVQIKKILEIQSFSEEDCKNCPGGLTLESVIDYINGL